MTTSLHSPLMLLTGLAALCLLLVMLVPMMLKSRHEKAERKLRIVLAETKKRLGMMSTIDSLTMLPNRDTVFRNIEAMIVECAARGASFHIMYLDLDAFRSLNDSYGSSVGDQLLRAFTGRLVTLIGSEGIVGRTGSDEFAVVLVRADEERARDMAARLLSTMRKPIVIDRNISVRLTVSIGIVNFPKDGDSADLLLRNGDRAMRAVKDGGRNGCRFYESGMDDGSVRTLQIQNALPEALECGQFDLHFQPKFGLDGSTIEGAEALIRWHHPVLGMVPPLEFIPVAERSGMIVQIGDWVIDRACQHLVVWRKAGMEGIRIAVNLSPKQLQQPGFVRAVTRMVARHDVSPSRLMFEITETVAMEFAEQTAANIREFQRAGFDIAIDDFGTGYSSLAYLQRFRARQLKIDRFFIRALDDPEDEGYAIVSAIIGLAHTLRMEVVAEGVETRNQLTRLAEMQCDQVQGYLLGRPMCARDFETFVRQRVAA